MNRKKEEKVEARFAVYVAGLAGVLGHADRIGPLRDYCTRLILPGERKSVEPMAAKTAPSRTAAQHQSLLHFVGIASWSDEKVLAKVREMVLPTIEKDGPIEAWIIDDTLSSSLDAIARNEGGADRQRGLVSEFARSY